MQRQFYLLPDPWLKTFSNNFCPCFILPGDGGQDLMLPWHSIGCCGDVWELLTGLPRQLAPLPFILHLV